MDIRQLVNPTEAPPRRSLSGSHTILNSSPAMSSANLATPSPTPNPKVMTGTRKRRDPKPNWAFRQDEIDNDGNTLQKHLDKLEKSRPPPPAPHPQQQTRPPPPAAHNGHHVTNGAPSAPAPAPASELIGFARPISDDREVYDDVSRVVCDFIWDNVINNTLVRQAVAESPDTQVEVEARWGQIQGRPDGQRMQGMHSTECVLKPAWAQEHTRFESTMTMAQHKKMNEYLNKQVTKADATKTTREQIKYKHTREIDQFYAMGKEGFARLTPGVREIITQTKQRPRIRVTRDAKDPAKILHKIIKLRIHNIEISSPRTEWDYRIGINLEVNFPGELDGFEPAEEPGMDVDSMKRHKDRVSYSWLKAFQIDLTQVKQGDRVNHELELELDAETLLRNGDYTVRTGQPSNYESLINGMMNNLRVLSREITPS
jgi:polynucleotide 5'-triphosphatase